VNFILNVPPNRFPIIHLSTDERLSNATHYREMGNTLYEQEDFASALLAFQSAAEFIQPCLVKLDRTEQGEEMKSGAAMKGGLAGKKGKKGKGKKDRTKQGGKGGNKGGKAKGSAAAGGAGGGGDDMSVKQLQVRMLMRKAQVQCFSNMAACWLMLKRYKETILTSNRILQVISSEPILKQRCQQSWTKALYRRGSARYGRAPARARGAGGGAGGGVLYGVWCMVYGVGGRRWAVGGRRSSRVQWGIVHR
jgi:hypothetical protein